MTDSEIAEAVGIVFGALTDKAAEQFEAICRKEGLIWRCRNCNWNVDKDKTTCEHCQTPAWGRKPADQGDEQPDPHAPDMGDPIA